MRELSIKKVTTILEEYQAGKGVTRTNNFFYQAIPNTLKTGVEILLTKEESEEYYKCKNDVKYFIEKYVRTYTSINGKVEFGGIVLRDYQIGWIDAFNSNRFIIYHTARQAGISLILRCLLLHRLMFTNTSISVHSNDIISKVWDMYCALPYFLKVGVISKNMKKIVFEKSIISTGKLKVDIKIVKDFNIDDIKLISEEVDSKLIIEGFRHNKIIKSIIKNSIREEGDPLKSVFHTVKTFWWEYMTQEDKDALIKVVGKDYFNREFDLL